MVYPTLQQKREDYHFLNLTHKYFSHSPALNKIFNKNNINVNCSCANTSTCLYAGHNNSILGRLFNRHRGNNILKTDDCKYMVTTLGFTWDLTIGNLTFASTQSHLTISNIETAELPLKILEAKELE